MTGVLLIDKPAGPTSHDVVACVRRATRERSVGHAGTLDPAATGLLVVMLGAATRLASLLTGHDKTYEATICLGQRTTTDDAQGDPIGDAHTGPWPDDAAIRAALDATLGTFPQMPPQFSAKRVDGTQAYKLARAETHAALKPSEVSLHTWQWRGRDGASLRIEVRVSTGFYVRSLARDLGDALGCGAHLSALRRTRSGTFDVADAVDLGTVVEHPDRLPARVVSMAAALPELPAVTLSAAGLARVKHGNPVGPQMVEGMWVSASNPPTRIRLLDPQGQLVALADLRGGLLQPTAVLG